MQMPYPDVQTLGTDPVLQQRKMNCHASHVRSAWNELNLCGVKSEGTTIVHGQPYGKISKTSRMLSMGSDPHNGTDDCQQLQTDQGFLVDDLVLPFPLDDGISRHIAATARQKCRVDPVDGQTHTHGYNTKSKSKAKMLHNDDDLQEKPSRVASKKMERNTGDLFNTPVELHKKQLDDSDIGLVLQWEESVTRPLAYMFAHKVYLLGTIGVPGTCCKLKMMF